MISLKCTIFNYQSSIIEHKTTATMYNIKLSNHFSAFHSNIFPIQIDITTMYIYKFKNSPMVTIKENMYYQIWLTPVIMTVAFILTFLSCMTSMCMTVFPLLSWKLGLAPLAMRRRTHSSCPRQAAKDSGYSPRYTCL